MPIDAPLPGDVPTSASPTSWIEKGRGGHKENRLKCTEMPITRAHLTRTQIIYDAKTLELYHKVEARNGL